MHRLCAQDPQTALKWVVGLAAYKCQVNSNLELSMTSNLPDLKSLVAAEIELLLNRCAAQGFDYDKTFSELNWQTSMRGWRQAEEAQRIEEAPHNAHLQRAYDAQLAGDKATHKLACLDWLESKHGVHLGDTVLVYGWVEPREILLDDFIINWSDDRNLDEGFMWLTGPTSHVAKGKNPSELGQLMRHAISKTTPSKKLMRMFPHRFASASPWVKP